VGAGLQNVKLELVQRKSAQRTREEIPLTALGGSEERIYGKVEKYSLVDSRKNKDGGKYFKSEKFGRKKGGTRVSGFRNPTKKIYIGCWENRP